MTHIRRLIPLALAFLASFVLVAPASAHQPWFEDKDIKADSPWRIKDPDVFTVVYATLDSASDVDYFSFTGKAGQRVYLAITIPQIKGQDEFAPTMALLGPGLAAAKLPARVQRSAASGILTIPPSPGPASTFFEPFSRTSYWERQERRVTLPRDGQYVVAVWHPDGTAGRYGFVIGEKERLGGDPSFPIKMRKYWTPVPHLHLDRRGKLSPNEGTREVTDGGLGRYYAVL